MARLWDYYKESVLSELQKDLGRQNRHAVPRLEKICLSMGLGKAIDDNKIIDVATRSLATIAGQAPTVTQAKVSVSNFRLRQGYKVGARVTLRRSRMYEFLDRLINAAVPRIRDFRGLNPNGFDRQGNYNMGVDELMIFPEIDPDSMEFPLGLNITFVVRNSEGPDESRQLLKKLGMPFRDM